MIHSVFEVQSAVIEIVTESETAEIEIAALAVALVLVSAAWGFRADRRDAGRVAVAAAAGFGLALATVTVAVLSNGWLTLADPPITEWLTGHRNSVATGIALAVTTAGGPPETAALAALVAAGLWWRTRRTGAPLVLLFTVGAASGVCALLKILIGRDRPPAVLHLVLETDRSFPSGHVTGTATLVFMTALVFGAHSSALRRFLLAVVASALVVSVALSRLYLGVHWFTDTLAGVLLAAVAAVLGSVGLHMVATRPAADGQDRVVVRRCSSPSRSDAAQHNSLPSS